MITLQILLWYWHVTPNDSVHWCVFLRLNCNKDHDYEPSVTSADDQEYLSKQPNDD